MFIGFNGVGKLMFLMMIGCFNGMDVGVIEIVGLDVVFIKLKDLVKVVLIFC